MRFVWKHNENLKYGEIKKLVIIHIIQAHW